MVVIGGMRSFLGPALGALFFILFREFLSIWTAELAVLLRPPVRRLHRVLADRPRRRCASGCSTPFRKRVDRGRRDGRPHASADEPLPAFLQARRSRRRRRSSRRAASPRASAASRPCRTSTSCVRDRTLHALIGPNGAGKTTAFNLISGMFAPDAGDVTARAAARSPGLTPEAITRGRASAARSRSPTCSRRSRSRRTCASPCRRAIRAASICWTHGARARRRRARDRGAHRAISASPASSAPRPARSPMAASACSTWALALATQPRAAAARRAARRARRRRARARRRTHQAHLGATCRCCWSSTTSTACSSSPTR